MNLLVVDSVDIPFGGAHSVHVSLLIKGLRKNGVNAFLIIPYGRKREALSASTKKHGHYDGIPFYIVRKSRKIKKLFSFIQKTISVFSTAFLIYKQNRKKNVDGIILGNPDIIRDFPVILTCIICKIPMYLWYVEKFSLDEDYYGIAGFFNKSSQELSEKLLPKYSSGVIVISSCLKKHYLNYLPENKTLINPILVSADMHKIINDENNSGTNGELKRSPEGKRLLVYSGSFAEKDGVHYLIDAFSQLVQKHPNTLFIMTGKNENELLMDRVKMHIKQLQLEDKIQLLGFVSSQELFSYNYMADILFVCRTNSSFANHGFPWKLGEYCMTGKPIIATRVSDIDYYFEDNESLFIVEPNNSKAIAEKIDYIFDNYEQALIVAKNGRETAIKCFDYITKTNELKQFIQNNN
ncbi:MAG TPA: glycosyltransferase [Chitinophagaceae bacterium]|jgi:glycosyltransferase involved in cell wall biosynthesis|nr:glycosyltransferase [Chitinophagaceae bacterium]